MNQNLPLTPLLPHQVSGSAALYYQTVSKSVLIGDEPRVGKTFTAINLEQSWRNLARKNRVLSGGGRTLVVSITPYGRM